MRTRIRMMALLLLAGSNAFAAEESANRFVQPAELKAPERGSIRGELSSFSTSSDQLARGEISIPLPIELPVERGAPGASLQPVYSPGQGISEWGQGVSIGHEITRYRVTGDLDFENDDLLTPWGRFVRGSDGYYYAAGLRQAVRIAMDRDGSRLHAYLSDGSTWHFEEPGSLATARGTYSWKPTRIVSKEGFQTAFEYETSTDGSKYLSSMRYGGLGDDHQYRVIIQHLPLETPLTDCRSGECHTLDRRVRTLAVEVRTGDHWAERFHYDFSFENERNSPRFLLQGIVKVHPGNAKEPAWRMRYASAVDALEQATWSRPQALIELFRRLKSALLDPAQSTLFDSDLDGRVDLESRTTDYSLFKRTREGFIEEGLPSSPSPDPACRPVIPASAPARSLLRMQGPQHGYSVVRLGFDEKKAQSELTVCRREGDQIATATIPGIWKEDVRTRFFDVNSDARVDLLRAYAGGYQVLANRSDDTHLRFERLPVGRLRPEVAQPESVLLNDVNGDGIADLIFQQDTGVFVWNGVGGFRFNEQGRFHRFSTSKEGIALKGLGQWQLIFIDVNQDGIADALLRKKNALEYYQNTGNEFVRTEVPAFRDALSSDFLMPQTADLLGSGNAQVTVQKLDGVASIELNRPDTGLLVSAEDGKGTRLEFTYERAPAEPGIGYRPALIASLRTVRIGHAIRRDRFTFSGSRNHPLNGALLGFTRAGVLGDARRTETRFEIDGDSGALPSQTRMRDEEELDRHRITELRYEDFEAFGLRGRRLQETLEGFVSKDGSRSSLTRSKILSYSGAFCPQETSTDRTEGTETVRSAYFSPEELTLHPTCILASEERAGHHRDATLDYAGRTSLEIDAHGRVSAIHSGIRAPRLLRRIHYGDNGRIESVEDAGRGRTHYSYDPNYRLFGVSWPDGKTVEVRNFDPILDLPTSIRTSLAPGSSFEDRFIYDSYGRLHRRWNSIYGGSLEQPDLSLEYQWADLAGDLPARILSSARVDARGNRHASAEFQSADGAPLAAADWSKSGWISATAVRRNHDDLESDALQRKILGGAFEDAGRFTTETLLSGRNSLQWTRTNAFGETVATRTVRQSGILGESSRTTTVVAGGLRVDLTENGRAAGTEFLDQDGHRVSWQDAAGGTYTYSYDASGRIRRILFPGGALQSAELDEHGLPTRIFHSTVGGFLSTYDPSTGLLATRSRTDRTGRILHSTAYTYDASGRIIREAHQDAAGNALTYERTYDGSLLRSIHGPDYMRVYEYSPDGSIRSIATQIDGGAGHTETLVHGADGSILSRTVEMTDARGRTTAKYTVESEFDAFGRRSGQTLNGNSLARIDFDESDLVRGIDLQGASRLQVEYDPLTARPNRTLFNIESARWDYRWNYDSRGLVAGESFAHASATGAFTRKERTYTFDSRKFLENATGESGTFHYDYDQDGLPTGDLLPMDSAGRASGDGEHRFSYLPNGRIGKILSATSSQVIASYGYDEAAKRLVKRKDGRIVESYFGDSMLDESGRFIEPVRQGDSLLGFLVNGTFEAAPSDLRNSVIADSQGNLLVRDAYGDHAKEDAKSPRAGTMDYARVGYDEDLRAYRMGTRDYNPRVGRFLTPDEFFLESLDRTEASPIEGNLYSYAANNPLIYTDSSGQFIVIPAAVGIAATVGLLLYEEIRTNAVSGDAIHSISSPVDFLAASLGAAAASRLVSAYTTQATLTSSSVKSVQTPYGPATQASDSASLSLKTKVSNGGSIYREGILGKQYTGDGQFWAAENPVGTPNYAAKYGTPNAVKPDWIIKASLKPNESFITRPAPAIGANGGGAPEVVVNPGAVRIDWFHMP